MAKQSKVARAFSSVYKFVWFCILGIVLLSFLVNGLDALFGDDTGSIALADGFTIESYNVVLDVHEDNKIDVTENITVNWNEEYHHGIYKFTPQWLKYTSKDGKTIKRKSVVSERGASLSRVYQKGIHRDGQIGRRAGLY